jgi:hypothetical protein
MAQQLTAWTIVLAVTGALYLIYALTQRLLTLVHQWRVRRWVDRELARVRDLEQQQRETFPKVVSPFSQDRRSVWH